MGYWSYYLLSFGFAYAMRNPGVASVAILFWLCRGFLPDPVVWLRTMGKIRRLRADITINPANLTAGRDLARLYLERRRPKQAIEVLEKTRERMANSTRHPQGSRDDADLLLHLGIAKLRAGQPEAAIDSLVAAATIAPDIGRGEVYLVAAEALMRLERWAEAEESLERSLKFNQSSVAVYFKIAQMRAKQKDTDGTTEAIAQAKATWSVLPTFRQRRELGWYVRALLAPIWL